MQDKNVCQETYIVHIWSALISKKQHKQRSWPRRNGLWGLALRIYHTWWTFIMIFYWQVGLSSEMWGPAQQCFEDVQVPSTLRDLRDLLKGAKFWLSFGNQCCLWWFVFSVINGRIVKIRLFTTQLRAITPRHLVTSWCWCRSTWWQACCNPSPLSCEHPIHLPRRNRPEIQAVKLVISKS